MAPFWRRKKDDKRDPGPSLVPWIADEVWREWNRGNTDPSAKGEKPGYPISEARVVTVSGDDRARAPVAPVPAGAPVPAPGTPKELEAMLDATAGWGHIGSVLWPSCCDRLATLISNSCDPATLGVIESRAGRLDEALLAAETESAGALRRDHTAYLGWIETLDAIRRGKYLGDGINFFQCRTCGRVYGASSEP